MPLLHVPSLKVIPSPITEPNFIVTIFRLIAFSFVFASSLVSASIDPRHLTLPLPATATPATMATTGTGTEEDVSPPTKRVRMNPADIKDGTGQSGVGAGAQSSQGGPSSSRPAECSHTRVSAAGPHACHMAGACACACACAAPRAAEGHTQPG